MTQEPSQTAQSAAYRCQGETLLIRFHAGRLLNFVVVGALCLWKALFLANEPAERLNETQLCQAPIRGLGVAYNKTAVLSVHFAHTNTVSTDRLLVVDSLVAATSTVWPVFSLH